MSLPAELASGRLVRVFVDEHWCTTHGGHDHSRVHLVVTELVTNAVRYGGPPIVFEINCIGADGVLVSVSDGSDAVPAPRPAGPTVLGGRGVHLVDLLSEEWGVEHHRDPHDPHDHRKPRSHGKHVDLAVAGEGKTVWCRMVA